MFKINYLKFNLKIATLNINGLNNERKQMMLIGHMNYNKIDIMLLQEHNIRDANNICSKLNENFYIILNLAICHKGGTAILIDRKLNFKVKNHEMSADSRIISAILEIEYLNYLDTISICFLVCIKKL